VDIAPTSGTHGRERRRTRRRVVHTPAYASLNGSAQTAPVELCEILNISETGGCIQAPRPMKVNRLLPLVLDLSETGTRIHTTGHVVWAESSGRAGIRFPELPEVSLQQLQKWMAVNDAAAKKNPSLNKPAFEEPAIVPPSPSLKVLRGLQPKPNSAAGYSSLLAEWAEIQKEVELFGPNLDAALQLIVERALALTWASGAAIAITTDFQSSDLICAARAGNDSPELGAHLDLSSGFTGECYYSGATLKCDDTETDTRIDCETYRAVGVRSLIACPIKTQKGGVLGVLEVFSPEPAAFWENDARTLERLARIAGRTIAQALRSMSIALPLPKSVRITEEKFAEDENPQSRPEKTTLEASPAARSAVLFATGILAVVFAVWLAAPWLSEAMSRFASPPKSQTAGPVPTSMDYIGTNLNDLRKIATQGSPAAQYSLGLRYASGDNVLQDYHQALSWFLKSAENGNLRAASKIASCFWAGKGAEQDYTKAYFWGLLAQAAGDETGRVIVINSSPHLTDRRRSAEQQEADKWLRSHHLASASLRAAQ
jgi:putative methionine-R-sulfoxide reductase with GAF domain